MKLVFLVVLSLVLQALAVLFEAWGLGLMWSWFAVPFGLPQIPFSLAVGIVLIVAMLWYRSPDKVDGMDEAIAKTIGQFVVIAFFIAFAFVMHLFV